MHRPFLTSIALFACVACNKHTNVSTSTADATAPITASVSASATAVPIDPEKAARAALVEIGFGRPLAPTPTDAIAANDAAYAKHAKADFVGSRAGFADAVSRAPDFVLARYNLACALSRLGELRAAREELERVLAADLVTFRARIDTDEDLASLRGSPEMATLRARMTLLQSAFSLAWREGLESLAWRGHVDSYHVETRLLRVGVYLAEQRRFVPLVPEVAGVVAAAIDRDRARALLVKARVEECGGGICPRLAPHVEVMLAAVDPASPEASVPMAHAVFDDPVGGPVVGVTAYTTTDGARFCVSDPGLQVSTVCKTIEGSSDEKRITIGFGGSGASVFVPSPAGFAFVKGALVLPDGRKVALSKEHSAGAGHAIVVAKDGKRAVVTSNVDVCDCEPQYHTEFRYSISRVDVTTGVADPLAHADGENARAAFAPNGDLFLQMGGKLVRYPGGLGTAEPVLDGVVLGIPLAASTGCCGA